MKEEMTRLGERLGEKMQEHEDVKLRERMVRVIISKANVGVPDSDLVCKEADKLVKYVKSGQI